MNKLPLMRYHILLTGLFCGLLLLSCHKVSKSEAETTVGDYKIPETIPLVFTVPEPFEWETITSDTLTTPVSYDLDVDALPTKPFTLNTFKPLKNPMKEYDLDWDNFPTVALKFDSVPFTIVKSTLKKPTITKMKPPGIMDGTNANLMQLSTNEGLNSNDITSFLETQDGAIWIGASTAALTHYDGENAFTYDYTGVYKMTFDKQGRLWMVNPTQGLIWVLDFKDDMEFTITVADSFAPLDILCDHTGTIYMSAFENGFYRMDSEIKSLQKLVNEGTNKSWRLFEDSKDNLWLGFIDGIAVLDKERKELKTLSGNTNYDLNTYISDIKEDQSGTIWLCLPDSSLTNNSVSSSLLQLSLKDKKIKVLDAENGYNIKGRALEEDNQGNFWAFGNEEVFVLSKNRNTYKTIGLNSKLSGNRRLTRPLKRKDGSLWIATTDKGVVIANDFTLKTEYFDEARGLVDDQVWDIEEDSRGELWLGTTKGINIIDPKKSTIKALSHELLHSTIQNTILYVKEISKDIYFIDATSGFSIVDRQKNRITQYASNIKSPFVIRGFAVKDNHTFLLYTRDGLFTYNIESNTLKKLISKTNPNILKAASQSLLVYDKEILWVPLQNGLAKVNLKTNTLSYLREEQGLCDNSAHVAYFSKEGELWVATLNGIAILNLEDNTLTNLKEGNGLLPAEMYDFIERGDTIYAASVDGLIPIDKASAKTTNKGFYTFNEGLGFKSTDYLEGSAKFLKNGQFWTGVGNTSNEFRLMVMNAAPIADTTVSSVRITSMFVMDEDPGFDNNKQVDSLINSVLSYAVTNQMEWDSITLPYAIPSGLELPYNQNSLSFSYGSGDLFNRDQLTYRFILDGEDEDWTYAATSSKTKNYYNLKPGQYTFKTAARGFNKQWSVPARFVFSINPPWWQTWWAYLLFAILFGSAISSFVAYRSRWLKKENRILEESVTHRTSQLKNKIDQLKATQSQLIQSEKMASLGELTAGIAHEIQNPLNFVNNFSEVNTELIDEMQEELEKEDYEEVLALSKDIRDNQQKINHHGRRADAIVKGMLQHSRNSTSEKEPSNINAIADEYLRLAYHGLRAKDKSFNATLNTDFDKTIGDITIVPQDVGRVILNLITNAFHAVIEKNNIEKIKENSPFKPTIWVTTKRIKNTVHVYIRDNGNGVPDKVKDKIFQPFFTTKPSGQGTGLGLSLSYDIIKTHGGELLLETKQGQGTTFTITLPEV
ncbi:ATP-binding protein [Maribacter antarcticus]|uniref:ATP-binding protein n=1 Tax=Maribacter antarcticus TaxID=505250 RepID=UPI000A053115|nr:ATP-binding protein [Maribacter antarcticus]